MQHAGQLHVVDEAPAAADESRVLLAQHPAEAHRVEVVVLEGHLPVRAVDGRHSSSSAKSSAKSSEIPVKTNSGSSASAWCRAAQRTDRTIVA